MGSGEMVGVISVMVTCVFPSYGEIKYATVVDYF